ncbi:MAG: DNA translocase FtsK [Flavobacteriia bacterium]|nr:DNA translocase FtsK [Flavobacteriia bacterium]
MAKKKATAATDPHLAHKRRQRQILFGSFLLLLGVLLLVAFTSYLFHWKADQSTLGQWGDDQVATENMVRKLGAWISHQMIAQGVGISAYIMALLISYTGLALFFNRFKTRLIEQWAWGMVYMLWLSLAFGFFATQSAVFSGTLGFELFNSLDIYIGQWGILSLLLFVLLCVLVLQWKITPEAVYQRFKSASADEIPTMDESVEENSSTEVPLSTTPTEDEITLDEETPEEDVLTVTPSLENTPSQDDIAIEVNTAEKEESLDSNLAQELVEKHGFFDPKLELSKYRFPTLDLLKDYGEGSITINQEELEQNKTKIVNTLKNYNIGIAQIKATIGPTVTLYEIVPDAGIRISKIKNLEDDIALSLSALGIRIIAPIPGKGTIGIEVPNQSATIVSMRSVIASPKFQKAEMELPIALGKTISNETFVVDLTKMPHLLMAGATGQGKSVGLNAVLTSLLYKKHPAEVKFVLIDPKKVELTIYNKIERHYLAKLPDTEEAIITDTAKVINTLNSLCIEMDNRYDLLKNALCRNLKEYNKKFKERKLNPNDGHDYLPYIVLVIDEFADLIMTAGKEVETPIARLAQLARAVGIHLIIATQRPSVNVITGIIKANFPARIAFRVTSKIDSRTILDSGGADQLIGRGDLLYTQGNDLTRIQCAFVDTPEVDKIAEFIGAQKGYAQAHQLPEYVGEGESGNLDIDPSERDALFREAAEVIVTAQQGSASLLQRKLKLGYNRAGRIIDQMEAAGIVGPFEGSKARQVLISDLHALEQLLNAEN